MLKHFISFLPTQTQTNQPAAPPRALRDLPVDLRTDIYSRLDTASLARMGCVSKEDAALTQAVWDKRYPLSVPHRATQTKDGRTMCKELAAILPEAMGLSGRYHQLSSISWEYSFKKLGWQERVIVLAQHCSPPESMMLALALYDQGRQVEGDAALREAAKAVEQSGKLPSEATHQVLCALARAGRHDIIAEVLPVLVPRITRTDWAVDLLRNACHSGNTETVAALCESLKKAGAAFNGEVRFTERTPLHEAAALGHDGVVKTLLDYGAEPHINRALGGDTPLSSAARAGSGAVCNRLLKAGGKFTVGALVEAHQGGLCDDELWGRFTAALASSLQPHDLWVDAVVAAAGLTSADLVKRLLSVETDTYLSNQERGDALVAAVKARAHDALRILGGVQVREPASTSMSLSLTFDSQAGWHLQSGSPEHTWVSAFVEADRNADAKSRQILWECLPEAEQSLVAQEALLASAHAGVLTPSVFAEYERHGASRRSAGAVLGAAALAALSRPNDCSAEQNLADLLRDYADVDGLMNTALCTAMAGAGHDSDAQKVAKWLVERGARVGDRDAQGQLPLVQAASNGFAQTVVYLLAQGAPVDATEADGRTALSGAAARAALGIITTLIDAGASTDAPAGAAPMALAQTPLGSAIASRKLIVVKTILDRNPTLWQLGTSEETFFHLAAAKGPSMLELLSEQARGSEQSHQLDAYLDQPDAQGVTARSLQRVHPTDNLLPDNDQPSVCAIM